MAEPKVRFKRDNGTSYPEYRELSLGECFDERNQRAMGSEELLAVTQTRGVILQRETVKRDISSDDKSNYKLVCQGDIAYNSMRMWQGAEGVSRYNGIVSPAYTIITPKNADIDASYFEKYFKTYKMSKTFERNSQGITSDTWNLKFPALSRIKVTIPCFEEQRKIADFLCSVDKVITSSEQEVVCLGTQKRNVMKMIFSQEVRFKSTDGSDFPDWKEKLLSDVSECLDNKRIPINATERAKIPGDIPYYGAGSIQGYINQFLFDEDLVLLLEDGDAFDDYKTKSISQFVTGKCWINNHAHVLRPLEDPFFLHCALSHKDIRAWTQLAGQSRKKLTQDNMLRITIKMPCIEEQRLIADFLSDFDKAIAAAKKELELWKELKKGLLQQMFV